MKNLTNSVIYVSKLFQYNSKNNDHFFPFLNSSLMKNCSIQKLSLKKIEAFCNYTNIRQIIPREKQCLQFVFFGRSNVGKSSLINALLGKNTVQMSKRPGKTKQLAFLRVNTTIPTYLVDAPGYGYASAASKHDINQWGKLVKYYLKYTQGSDNQMIMVLIDLMHGVKSYDIMLLDMLKEMKKNFTIVFTKSDRAKDKHVEKGETIVRQIMEVYNDMSPYVHFTSANKSFGIDQLRSHLLFRIINLQQKFQK